LYDIKPGHCPFSLGHALSLADGLLGWARRRGASAGQAPPVLSGDGAWTEQALSSLTLAELRALGKVRGVRGLSGLKKADVVRRLAEAGGGGSGGAGGEA